MRLKGYSVAVKQRFVQIISMYLFFTIFAINCMDIENLKKRAWQDLFDGKDAESLTHFAQAANEGDIEASQFLAYNYGKEPLIGTLDESKAQFFEEQTKTLIDQAKIKAKQSKSYYSNYLLQSGLENKIKKVKSIRFAKNNSWHQQILDELNHVTLSSDISSSYRNDYYRYYLPEESITRFFGMIKNSKGVDKEKILARVHLLDQGLQALQSKKIIIDILESLSEETSSFYISNNAEINYDVNVIILQNMDAILQEFGLLAELTAVYKSFSSRCYRDYLGHGQEVEKAIIVRALVTIFPAYMAVNQQAAIKSLSYFLDHDIKYSHEINDDFMNLLALLPLPHLDEYITKYCLKSEFFLPSAIENLCKNPQVAEKFKGTVLSVDALAEKLLDQNLDEVSIRSLTSFLEHSNALCYQTYLHKIIAILPIYLKKSPHEYRTVISMMTQRNIPELQDVAIEVLLGCDDSFWLLHIVENLLQNKDLSEDQRKSLYLKMNAMWQQKKFIKPLQMLWVHLKKDLNNNHFLYNSVIDYFNVPHAMSTIDTNKDFATFFNEILKIARAQATLPEEQFLETLKIAHETSLSEIIDATFLDVEKDRVILNDQAPFKERAIFLDQRLLTMKSSPDILNLFQKIFDTTNDDEFKAYVLNIFITIKSNSSSYQVCKAKKDLQNLHKKYDMRLSVPMMVWNCAHGNLENFAYYRFRSDDEKPVNRIVLCSDIKHVYVDSGELIYALKYNGSGKPNDYTFFAIDETTLDAVWSMPATNCNKFHFIIDGEKLYTAIDSCIKIYNKKDGTMLSEISISNNLPITGMRVDETGLLYIIQDDDNVIMTLNLQTQEGTVIEKNVKSRQFYIAGQTFVYFDMKEKSIVFHTKNEPKRSIKMLNDDRFPVIVTQKNSSHILYVDKNDKESSSFEKKDYQLIYCDAVTGAEKWSYPLQNELKGKPCVSKDETQIFLMTRDHKIIALKNDHDSVQDLWNISIHEKTSRFNFEVYRLAINHDGKTLFCLEETHGILYTIDAITGMILATDKCEEGRGRHLIGVCQNGLPCIHGFHY